MKARTKKPERFPGILREEFKTIDVLLDSEAATSRTDALILACTKYEKQLRKILMFLIYKSPNTTPENRNSFLQAIVDCGNLYPRHMECGIRQISGKSLSDIVGDKYQELKGKLDPVLGIRNKLIHGQNTGKSLESAELEEKIRVVSEWMSSLAVASKQTLGYDGLGRDVFRKAKSSSKALTALRQFDSTEAFTDWLNKLCKS
jgi:hypothetical protein